MNRGKKKKTRLISEEDFSSDLRVMAKIYEYNKIKKKPIWCTRIENCFRGKLASGVIRRALYKLEELCAIKIDNKFTEINGKYVFLISIANCPIEYAKETYELIEKVKKKEDITKDLEEIEKRAKEARDYMKKHFMTKQNPP